jgi:hypothetical protein
MIGGESDSPSVLGPVRTFCVTLVCMMDCDERARLLAHCAATMHAYTQASIKWQELTGFANTLGYRLSRDAREQARVQADLASYQLEQHEGLHRCFPAAQI